MSSPAEELFTSEFSLERRFYCRTAPSSFVAVNLGDDNPGMLLNLSENGLLVAAPKGLAENFVCRVSLLLNGLLRPIEVLVRVVWTTDAKRAGIQMLDLCEYDREQIRKWAARAEARKETTTQTAAFADRTVVEAAMPSPEPELELESESTPAPVLELEEEPARTTIQKEAIAKKRKSVLIPVTVCTGSILMLLTMGAAVWVSPLRPWLARSFGAVTKYAMTMATPKAGKSSSVKMDAQLPAATHPGGQNGGPQIATMSEFSPSGNGEVLSSTSTQGSSDARAAEPMNQTPMARAKADSTAKQTAEEVAIDGDAVRKSTSETVGDNLATEKSAGNPQGARDAVVAAPADGIAARVDANAPQPTAIIAGKAPGAPARASVIQTEAPKSQVLEITLPNSARPSVLALPGERVLQSDAVTLHIQRSILTPPVYGWWNGVRKKKVVVGDLLSRVDPQLPRQTQGTNGRVSVRAILGKDGRLERLMPVNGPVSLVASVARAMREWRFQPTLVDGKPVETGALVLVEFHTPTN